MTWFVIFTCAAGFATCGLQDGRYELPTKQTNERDCILAGELALSLLKDGSFKDKIKVSCELKEKK